MTSATRQIWSRRSAVGPNVMDILLDTISVNTFWTILLIVHALLAVATLGALTHQAMSVAMPVRRAAGPRGFITRFLAVQGAGYATAVCVLWVVTMILGAWIYTKYRIAIRIPLERTGYWKTLGFFALRSTSPCSGWGCFPSIGIFGRTRKILISIVRARRSRFCWPRCAGSTFSLGTC